MVVDLKNPSMNPYKIHLIDFAENVFEIRDLRCASDSEAIARAFRHDFPRYEARFEVWQDDRLIYTGHLGQSARKNGAG